MPTALTTRERAHLKARAHALEPVVQAGSAGVTDALVAEVDVGKVLILWRQRKDKDPG